MLVYFSSRRKYSGWQPQVAFKNTVFYFKSVDFGSFPAAIYFGSLASFVLSFIGSKNQWDAPLCVILNRSLEVLRVYQMLYTNLLDWNINNTSICQMTFVTSYFSMYFSNTQCNEIFKVIWIGGHNIQPTWDFINANFYEIYISRESWFLFSGFL